MLLMTLMLIALTIEAPRIAQQIKREKEEELIHRGNEYKTAIKKYFRKTGRYPATIEELTNTNNMRFLRKKYVDPFTGKDDWRLLHPGEVQINPLQQGTNAPGQPIGGAAGSTIGNPGGLSGSSPTSGSLFPSQPAAGAQNQPGIKPAGTPQGQPTGTMAMTGTTGSNSPVQFGGGPIIGVASTSSSVSIKLINDKNHYNEWYFVYDPRLEQQNLPPGAPGGVGTNPVGGIAPNTGGQMNAPGLFGQPNQQNPPGQMGAPGLFGQPNQQNPPGQNPPPQSPPRNPQ